jgi:hypothetical protein
MPFKLNITEDAEDFGKEIEGQPEQTVHCGGARANKRLKLTGAAALALLALDEAVHHHSGIPAR